MIYNPDQISPSRYLSQIYGSFKVDEKDCYTFGMTFADIWGAAAVSGSAVANLLGSNYKSHNFNYYELFS